MDSLAPLKSSSQVPMFPLVSRIELLAVGLLSLTMIVVLLIAALFVRD
jgi:hypothetical protein